MTTEMIRAVAAPAEAAWAHQAMADRMALDLIEAGTDRADRDAVGAQLAAMGWAPRLIEAFGPVALEFSYDIAPCRHDALIHGIAGECRQ